MTYPRRRRRGAAAALAVALPALAVAPATASAAGGATTIDLRGPAARALRAHGVAISARKPAKAGPRRIVLPVAKGSRARLVHRGAVVLRSRAAASARGRAVRLTAWQTRVTPRRATVTARLGKRRVPVFVATYRPQARTLGDRAVTVTRSTTRLARPAVKALRRALGVSQLRAGVVGTTRVKARLAGQPTGGGPQPTPPNAGGGTGGGGGGSTTPPTPGSPACHGFGSETVPVASPPLTKPDGAATVTAATFWWSPKDSWMRYINSGYRPGDGVHAADGATPDRPHADTVVYRYRFTLDSGSWYDGAKGVLYFRGTVRFRWEDHGLDITVANPEVQLDGAASRLVFRFTGSECSTLRNQRVELAKLAVGTPTGTPPAYDFGTVTATITDPGAGAFSRMYRAGTEWGAIELAFTTS